MERTNYGNWVSKSLLGKVLVLFAVFFIAALCIFILAPGLLLLGILICVCTTVTLISFVYFAVARRMFSIKGGNVQDKILETLLSYIQWNGMGKALDIGCGSGALTIKLAKKYKETSVTGVDYWGKSWNYAKKQCEGNAVIEGVDERTDFVKASASKLPFEDKSFDLIVSNLTFHEVKDSSDKREVVKEALRTVKKGGVFAFQDLFKIKQYYGEIDDLLAGLKAFGVQEVRFEDTSSAPFIPGWLKLPFMVGTMGVIYGIR